MDNTDDESLEGNSGLHPNEQGSSRGRAEESDGSEDLDSSSQSDSEEDCDPEEAKILSGQRLLFTKTYTTMFQAKV